MADENQKDRSRECDHDRNQGWCDELNELTLSVMANRTKYDKCKKTLANTSDTVQETFRKEKLYYKERILNMTRDLFHERCENENINDAHQAYIKSCIEYLKWNDITDMVSEDKRNEVRHDDEESQSTPDDLIQARHELQQKIRSSCLNEEQEHGPRDINDDADDHQTSSPPPPSPPHLPHPPSQTHNIMSIANKMCIRKKTIDDFIVMKPRVENNDQDIHSRLPKVRDYQTEISKRVVAAAERLT
jgi:hypothetical protein